MKKIIVVILLCYSSMMLSAQLGVTSGFHADSVRLGDQISYTVTIKLDNSIDVREVELSRLDSIISLVNTQLKAQTDTADSGPAIGDYTIASYGKWKNENSDRVIQSNELSWDTTKVNKELLLENTLKISFWDAGPHIVKSPKIHYRFRDQDRVYSPRSEAQVFVIPPLSQNEITDSLDLAPLKPILQEGRNITDFYILFYILGGFLLLAGSFLFWKKSKETKNEVREIIIPKTAHEIAFEKLTSLREKKLWQKGEIKAYQSELTYVIREYLENRYNIQALESTTQEIVQSLKGHDFDMKDESELKNILQVADLVKFAKAKPKEDVHEQFLNTAEGFVASTKSDEIPQEVLTINGEIVDKEIDELAAAAPTMDGNDVLVRLFKWSFHLIGGVNLSWHDQFVNPKAAELHKSSQSYFWKFVNKASYYINHIPILGGYINFFFIIILIYTTPVFVILDLVKKKRIFSRGLMIYDGKKTVYPNPKEDGNWQELKNEKTRA